MGVSPHSLPKSTKACLFIITRIVILTLKSAYEAIAEYSFQELPELARRCKHLQGLRIMLRFQHSFDSGRLSL